MVAAANKALSSEEDGNQQKLGLSSLIPAGSTPQQAGAALAARPATDVAQGTGFGLNLMSEGMAPVTPTPEPAKKMGWNDVPPMRAPDNARNIYANMGMDDLKSRANMTATQAAPQAQTQQPALAGLAAMAANNTAQQAPVVQRAPMQSMFSTDGNMTVSNLKARSAQFDDAVSRGNYGNAAGIGVRAMIETPGAAVIDAARGVGRMAASVPVSGFVDGLVGGDTAPAVLPPSTLPMTKMATSAPQQASYSNEGRGYPAGGKVQSPAVTTAPSAQQTDIGSGITKIVKPGESTGYTNVPGAGMGFENRRAITPQNAAAMGALSGRYESEQRAAAQNLIAKEKYAAEVAQAQAINKAGEMNAAQVLDDMAKEKGMPGGNVKRLMQQRQAETDAADKKTARGLEERRLKQDDTKLGLDAQRLLAEQQNGALGREAKGMEIAAAKQLQALQSQLLDPKATDAQRLEIGKKIAALQGKTEKPEQWDSVVVNGGTDANGNKIGGSAMLFNKATGEYKPLTAPGGAAPSQTLEAGKAYPRSKNGVTSNYVYLGGGKWSDTPLK